MQARLNRWYAELARIERESAQQGIDPAQPLAQLAEVDATLHELRVPKAYLGDLHTLREHAQRVRRNLEWTVAPPDAPA